MKDKLTMKNIHLNVLRVYRPPPSKSKVTMVSQFIDEFLENLQDEIISSDHLIILGDFNIHINDENYADTQAFSDCTDDIKLGQQVDTYPHKQGHILDHIYTLVGEQPRVQKYRLCSFIADHHLIDTRVSIQRNDIGRCSVLHRCYKNFDLDKFKK